MQKEIKILAIETSCDETAAAVVSGSMDTERVDGSRIKSGMTNSFPVILSNVISSQADLHAKTGGVVPEVASRAHVEAIVPVITQALLQANEGVISNEVRNPAAKAVMESLGFARDDKREELDYQSAIKYLQSEITHIAVTAGPGLIGALLIGFNAAKTLAYALDKPIIPINHIEGHVYSALCAENFPISNFQFPNNSQIPNTKFPTLIFTASGGHTLLILMHDHGKYEILGQTIDDAIGEAYDKVARLLGLGYPGGPLVSALAKQYRRQIINYQLSTRLPDGQVSKQTPNTKYEIRNTIKFPRPIMNDGTYNFSFSGLKTAVLRKVQEYENMFSDPPSLKLQRAGICAAFEEAVADVVSTKIARAAIEFEPKAIAFAGGVAANSFLREKIQEKTGQAILVPAKGLTGDNAAMIGLAAYYHILRGDVKKWSEITVDSNLSL